MPSVLWVRSRTSTWLRFKPWELRRNRWRISKTNTILKEERLTLHFVILWLTGFRVCNHGLRGIRRRTKEKKGCCSLPCMRWDNYLIRYHTSRESCCLGNVSHSLASAWWIAISRWRFGTLRLPQYELNSSISWFDLNYSMFFCRQRFLLDSGLNKTVKRCKGQIGPRRRMPAAEVMRWPHLRLLFVSRWIAKQILLLSPVNLHNFYHYLTIK